MELTNSRTFVFVFFYYSPYAVLIVINTRKSSMVNLGDHIMEVILYNETTNNRIDLEIPAII